MKSCLFLLALVPLMIGCGNPHTEGVATGTDDPPEVHTEEFEAGEEALAMPPQEESE